MDGSPPPPPKPPPPQKRRNRDDDTVFEGEARPLVLKQKHVTGNLIKPGQMVNQRIGHLPSFPSRSVPLCTRKIVSVKNENGNRLEIGYGFEICGLVRTTCKVTIEDFLNCDLFGGYFHRITKEQLADMAQSLINAPTGTDQSHMTFLNREFVVLASRMESTPIRLAVVSGFSRAKALCKAMKSSPAPFTKTAELSLKIVYIDSEVFDGAIRVGHRVTDEIKDYSPKATQDQQFMQLMSSLYGLRKENHRLTKVEEGKFYHYFLLAVLPPAVASTLPFGELEDICSTLEDEGYSDKFRGIFYSMGCGPKTRELMCQATVRGLQKKPYKLLPNRFRVFQNLIRLSKIDDVLVFSKCIGLVESGDFRGESWKKALGEVSASLDGKKAEEAGAGVNIKKETKKNKARQVERYRPVDLSWRGIAKHNIEVKVAGNLTEEDIVLVNQSVIHTHDGVEFVNKLIQSAGAVCIKLPQIHCEEFWPPTVLGKTHLAAVFLCQVDSNGGGGAFYSVKKSQEVNSYLVPKASMESILLKMKEGGLNPCMLKEDKS